MAKLLRNLQSTGMGHSHAVHLAVRPGIPHIPHFQLVCCYSTELLHEPCSRGAAGHAELFRMSQRSQRELPGDAASMMKPEISDSRKKHHT